MHSKHEAPAVSAAASLIATAILILQHSGESIGIGIRTEAERSLQRLGPDHVVDPLKPDALRAFLAEKYGEEFAVDVVDNNAPVPHSQAESERAAASERLDKLEKSLGQLADDNARLRAENEALTKGKDKKPTEDKKPA